MLLMSLLFVSNLAMADVPTPPAEPTAAARNECKGRRVQRDKDVPADVKEEILKKCLEVAASQAALAKVTAQIRTTTDQASIQNCIDDARDEGRNWFQRTFTGKRDITDAMVEKCQADVKKAREALKAQQEALARQQAALKTQEDAMVARATGAIADANTARGVASVVGDEFRNMRMSILELLRQGDQGEAQLNKLATAIDNSALGVYMRDRMAGLLNSDKMCEMIKTQKCPIGVTGKDLNPVFDSKMKTKAADVPRPKAPAPPASTNR